MSYFGGSVAICACESRGDATLLNVVKSGGGTNAVGDLVVELTCAWDDDGGNALSAIDRLSEDVVLVGQRLVVVQIDHARSTRGDATDVGDERGEVRKDRVALDMALVAKESLGVDGNRRGRVPLACISVFVDRSVWMVWNIGGEQLGDGLQVDEETARLGVATSLAVETRDATTVLLVDVVLATSVRIPMRDEVEVDLFSQVGVWGVVDHAMLEDDLFVGDLFPSLDPQATERRCRRVRTRTRRREGDVRDVGCDCYGDVSYVSISSLRMPILCLEGMGLVCGRGDGLVLPVTTGDGYGSTAEKPSIEFPSLRGICDPLVPVRDDGVVQFL